MKRKLMLLLTCLFIGIGLVTAQNQKVTGVVLSEDDGQPVVGASILVKGTTLGTVTDLDGKFLLPKVPNSARTLVVSYIGMRKLEVSIKPIMEIKLKSDAKLVDEIVITAAGIKRSQKALGYAATTVTNKDVTATGDRSALNALEGKIAGAEITSASGAPGASTRVVLRGFSSLNGSSQPLYIIDGVPINNGVVNQTDINGGVDFGNRANDINPNDIESMTVLKGGSGTALYGSRAANGVIIITTKNGSKSNRMAKVNVSSTTTFDTPLRLPLMQNEYGQGWYDRTVSADLEENGSWGPKLDGVNRPWGHVVDNQQQVKPYSALKNNIKDFFDLGVAYNNSIDISNGDDNTSYYFSLANISSNGIMPTDADSYKRNNASLRGSTKFLKIFKFSTSLNYVRKDSKFVPTGQQQSVLDGLWQNARDMSVVDMKDYNNKFNNVANYYTVYAQNPYYVLNEHGNKFQEDRAYGNVALEAQPLDWLTATLRLGTDASNSTLKSWRAITPSPYNDEVGRVSESSYRNTELNTDFTLDAKKNFGETLSLDVILGHNFNQRDYRYQTSQVIGLDIPGYYNLANSSSKPTVTDGISKRRLVGAYGSVDLGYKSMIFLNLSGRNDWSSTLPSNNRSFFYPGASASFLFTELLKDKSILSYGKVRFGVAQTGNDADPYMINPVMVQTVHDDGYAALNYPLTNGTSSVNGFTVSNRIGNNMLQPEISTDSELGLELKFFGNRIGLDLAVYNKAIKDLIQPVTISAATGYTSQMMNIGKITNKGIEISLSAIPVQTKDFKWEVYANFTQNKNKLVELTQGLDQISLGGTSSVGFVSKPGYELGLFEGTVVKKDDKGHTVVDATGLPVFADKKEIIGQSQNKFRIGGGTTLSYKGLSLRATFDYRNGGVMYSRTAEMMYFTGNAPQTTDNDRQPFIVPNSVQIVGGNSVENTTPIAGYDNNLNKYYNQTYNAGIGGGYVLLSKTFFKLRELTLAYELPKSILNKTFIKSASFALIGRNLFLWTPNSNSFVDPESTTFGNEIQANYGEYGATPTTKSFGFSINLGF
ncbi:SusC/RagA family TonB-linked outer membrane protein [uncultured Bacteroides sp.]|uniref:SusC/RagA family TonB-linked outer membrane protein n=1 Tax=uncultured Bacteroides sp. TaxID=162156 RepID=UPI002AA6D1AA|nr:SusC/RagA family TonB-linked outer membrane protein [uncultured Bacteroides sp.]